MPLCPWRARPSQESSPGRSARSRRCRRSPEIFRCAPFNFPAKCGLESTDLHEQGAPRAEGEGVELVVDGASLARSQDVALALLSKASFALSLRDILHFSGITHCG